MARWAFRHRRGRRHGAGSVGEALAAVSSVNSFSIAVLPDTQFYSRYATTDEGQQYQKTFGSTPFAAETGWIAANAAKYNINFTVHLGDVVDQVGKNNQWIVADGAMELLETAKIPIRFSPAITTCWPTTTITCRLIRASAPTPSAIWRSQPHPKWFPTTRAAKQSTFRGRDFSETSTNITFEVSGIKFLVLSLSWRISDLGIAWARQVMANNPTLPVILANHQLLNIDSDAVSPLQTDYGQMLWQAPDQGPGPDLHGP